MLAAMNSHAAAAVLWIAAVAALRPAFSAQPLAYDTSAWELAPGLVPDPTPWTRPDLEHTLRERTALQQARHEITVYYYRIGHTLAFPLPVTRRPTRAELPPGVANLTYPWLIWLTWELEERWRILHFAWRTHGDTDAGRLLQRELAALATWEKFAEMNDQPGLGAAHLAGCLAQALANPAGWDPALLASAQAAARHLLDGDIAPWFAKQWAAEKPWTPSRLANIPVITLARAAELARVTDHPLLATLDRRMIEILRVWARFRSGAECHTEGTTYDGYLLDSLTGWLAAHPQRAELLRECEPAFRSVSEQWIHLTLPGRADLNAPIGDVEPEMPFWAAVLTRTAAWHQLPENVWLLQRMPVSRLPAAAITDLLGPQSPLGLAPQPPAAAPRSHPHAVSLRTGWAASDAAAIVSAVRNPMGHLQADAGQVVLGWQGRFWITDPGYQQYRKGEERDYTLETQAHNAPIINGTMQKPRAARVELVDTDPAGRQHTRLELAACYLGLPKGAQVKRDIWLARSSPTVAEAVRLSAETLTRSATNPAASGNDGLLVVRDQFAALRPDTEILHHWLGGHHLAWAFVDGWARLSDGRRAVWIGSPSAPIQPAALTRHPGSRGPLALVQSTKLATGTGVRWWIFWCDEAGGWTPPKISADDPSLQITAAGQSGPAWTFTP
jgi:hypothetical protein